MVPAVSELPADAVVNVSLDESGSVTANVTATLPAETDIAVLSPSSRPSALYGTGYDVWSNVTEPRLEAIVETP